MIKGTEVTFAEIATEIKKMLSTERHAQSQRSKKLLVHINMFYQHYLRNKKPTSLAFNAEQVYATILESSESKDPFQNRQTYSRWILEIFQNFLDMVSVSTCCSLLAVVRKLKVVILKNTLNE